MPDNTTRDAITAAVAGLLIVAFLVFGFLQFTGGQRKARSSTATGIVIEKAFTPRPEEQISFGQEGLKTKTLDGEYLLKVRVEAEGRTFEVPVEKEVYARTEVGDSMTFLRPRRERTQ